MTINLFQTPEYKAIMEAHLSTTLAYLFEKDQEFTIVCEIRHVSFLPELPSHIHDSFKDTVLFVLSGYTLQSAEVKQGVFSFEAGFGSENFGSTVSMPLLAIKQLFVEEMPVVINHVEVASKLLHKDAAAQSSMDLLLNHPKNKRFLKKK